MTRHIRVLITLSEVVFLTVLGLLIGWGGVVAMTTHELSLAGAEFASWVGPRPYILGMAVVLQWLLIWPLLIYADHLSVRRQMGWVLLVLFFPPAAVALFPALRESWVKRPGMPRAEEGVESLDGAVAAV